jgi:hypothetical protein
VAGVFDLRGLIACGLETVKRLPPRGRRGEGYDVLLIGGLASRRASGCSKRDDKGGAVGRKLCHFLLKHCALARRVLLHLLLTLVSRMHCNS